LAFSGGAVAAPEKAACCQKFLIADTAFPCMLVEKVFRILEFGAKSTGTAVVPFDHLVVFLRNKSDTSFFDSELTELLLFTITLYVCAVVIPDTKNISIKTAIIFRFIIF
jgi:hypothetical protein